MYSLGHTTISNVTSLTYWRWIMNMKKAFCRAGGELLGSHATDQAPTSGKVRPYFTSSRTNFTLVAEPPDPSKSMLVELLMILLGNIEDNAWYCIGSNASMDVCGSFCPHAVIIGGSSRAMEVSCILSIVQGLRTGQLKRVLVSGDSQQQLPPARLNARSHAASNGEVSMKECLEAAEISIARLSLRSRIQSYPTGKAGRWWTCCTVVKPHQNMVTSVIS
jgi:hypothetical protein